MVTVVDAANLIKHYSSTDMSKIKEKALVKKRTHPGRFTCRKIEFAIILNKRSDPPETSTTVKALYALNTEAKSLKPRSENISDVMNTDYLTKKPKSILYGQRIYHFQDHVLETEEYGIKVGARARTVDPVKFAFSMSMPGIARPKGSLACSRPEFVGGITSRCFATYQGMGQWYCRATRSMVR